MYTLWGKKIEKERERKRKREKEKKREIHYYTKGLQENYDLVYYYTKVSNNYRDTAYLKIL